ncbi:MAG: DUF190 domain-containing protein [Burkholderiales bacterium]
MNGFQLTLFLRQDDKHGHQPMSQWLVAVAKRLGIGGATVIAAAEGFGHGGRLHSAHFFELADQPVELTMALSAADAGRVFELLKSVGVDLFYLMAPIEFGMTGQR